MPFDSSLPDEVAPGEATALRCKYWNVPIRRRCNRIYDHMGIHKFELTSKEPKGSASSSPDEKCTCGCTRVAHMGKPRGCLVHGFHEFAPAALPPSEGPEYDKCACGHERHEHSSQFLRCGAGGCFCDDPDYSAAAGETAGEPECLCSSGSPENYEGPARDCPTHGEPEARYCGAKGECRDPLKRCGLKCRREFPQCRAQFHGGSVGYRCQLPERHSEPHTNKIPDEGTFNWDDSVAVYPTEPEAPCPCIREGGCCHAPGVCLHGCREAADEVTRLGEEMEPEAPELRLADLGKLGPRPPYAVAYATGSGVLNEIALPGDATAAVMDGALVISHPSGVLGIQHVKPYELEQS